MYKVEDVYGTLAEIILGKPGWVNDDEITVFDSTGIAIEVIAPPNWSKIMRRKRMDIQRSTW